MDVHLSTHEHRILVLKEGSSGSGISLQKIFDTTSGLNNRTQHAISELYGLILSLDESIVLLDKEIKTVFY
jgi:hypothetical protein